MRLIQPDPSAALLGLRAMKTVALSAGAIGPSQRAVMEAARRFLLKLDADIDTLPTVDPATLAAGFPGDALRRQFVNGMMVVALADGICPPATQKTVEAFAEALGIDSRECMDLRALTEHHMLTFRLDFLRRGHIADIMRDQFDQHGLFGLAKSVLTMRGVIDDKPLAARYRAWERLPDDTLGHALWRYYEANRFAMPGERGGFPEAGVHHDFSHVLAGYGTDGTGEIEVAAFTAGYKTQRPFYIVLFAVMIFSAGVNVRPTAGGSSIGLLGEAGVAERMFAAMDRGGSVVTDLSHKWDYWPYVALPLQEAQARLGIT